MVTQQEIQQFAQRCADEGLEGEQPQGVGAPGDDSGTIDPATIGILVQEFIKLLLSFRRR